VVLVSGNVYNAKTKQPLSADLIYETLPDGAIAGNGSSNPDDGAFKIVLPYDKNYSIRATADKFFAVSENLNLDSLVKEGYKEIHKDLYLVPIEIGQVVRLNNVFFDFDKFFLRPESFVELDRVVKLLNENPAIEIEMSAHTDSKGSDEYNYTLSDNRARSVMEYIISKGISSSRIRSKGYGETKPVVSNDTDEGRQLNRRVEFVILKN
jgi:outer membrane protein OmpA-like peptidoglycan-associated protein